MSLLYPQSLSDGNRVVLGSLVTVLNASVIRSIKVTCISNIFTLVLKICLEMIRKSSDV